MVNTRLRSISLFVVLAGAFACQKKHDTAIAPPPVVPVNVQFRFGPGASPITIDSSNKILRNLPAGCDLQKLSATVVLPSGYSISPDPSTVQDYTKGVNFSITGSQGSYNIKLTALPYDSIANPYGIYTVMDLNNVRHYLKGYFVLINDISLPNVNDANADSLTGISDYATYGWYSIGSHYVNGGHIVFRGSLDGQNHVIRNLWVTYRGSGLPMPNGMDSVSHDGKSNDGLFGYAVGGRFKNIGIQLAGDINGISPSEGRGGVGALVGYADTCSFTNCYVTGAGSISGVMDAGGLVGTLRTSTVTKCYSSITHTPGNFAIVNGGGLLGSAYFSTISYSNSSCDVTGSGTLGGLVGYVSTTTIVNAFATGAVVEAPSAGGSLIPSNTLGGLVGTIQSVSPSFSLVNNCYAVGNVTGASSGSASYLGSSYIGGLVGTISPTASKVTVSNCYVAGAVTRTFNNGDTTAPVTGGLVGNTFNGIFAAAGGTSSNYWDRQISTQSKLGGGNATIAPDNGITANGMTTVAMKTQATYSGWDFTSTWGIDQSKNNGYPYLR